MATENVATVQAARNDDGLLADVERLADRQTVLAVITLMLLPVIGFVYGFNAYRSDEAAVMAFVDAGLGFGVGLVWYTRQKLQAKTAVLLSRAATPRIAPQPVSVSPEPDILPQIQTGKTQVEAESKHDARVVLFAIIAIFVIALIGVVVMRPH